MSRRGFDVCVIGAGVVGAAAALALAKDGLQVALVEAHEPKPWHADSADLRVYAFAPDNRDLLTDLGVWASIASARAQAYRQMRVWDAAGGGELHFRAEQIGREELGHIVEHGLLVDRLWLAIAGEARINRYCPDKLAAVEQDERGAIVILDSGERLRCALVLGADGAASKVRAAIGLQASTHEYAQHALVAYVRTELAHEDTAWQRFLPGGPLAFLPCSDGRSSIVWTVADVESQRLLALADAQFCRELTRAFDARLGEVTQVSQRGAFPLRRQLADEYSSGRVILIGDAAHAVHPLAGQGVNLGLRDVVALRALLRDAKSAGRDMATPHRLQRWARNRRSENALAAYSFEAINRLFSNDDVLPTLLRGHALGLAGRIAPLGQFFLRRAAGL